jgi:hypothetical protein
MIFTKKLDHSAVTVKSCVPVHSKNVLQVNENFKCPIFLCWALP